MFVVFGDRMLLGRFSVILLRGFLTSFLFGIRFRDFNLEEFELNLCDSDILKMLLIRDI